MAKRCLGSEVNDASSTGTDEFKNDAAGVAQRGSSRADLYVAKRIPYVGGSERVARMGRGPGGRTRSSNAECAGDRAGTSSPILLSRAFLGSPNARCNLYLTFLPLRQAASRELLNDLHDVTKSLGFWETKLHDTPRRLWWFLLLQTGPGHFYGTLFSSVRNLLNSCSSLVRNPGKEGRRLPPISTGLRKAYISPHLQVDGKVRVLSSMQFSLASAVGEVHRHAGNVANAWNSERADAESLRKLLHDALTGLLGSLQAVSKSKTLPSSSTGLDDSPKLSQSPLSKAVNTAFSPRHSRLGERGKAEGLAEVRANEFHGSSTDAAGKDEGIKEIRRLIRKLELEGSKASANAKAVIAANTRPRQWQRRWVLYSGLCSAVCSATLFAIRHSKLCGSSDLDNFIQSLWSSLLRFWNTHAVTPWR